MTVSPRSAQRWVRRLVFVALAAVLYFGLRDLRFRTVAEGDRGTPELPPGTRVFVTTPHQDGEWIRGALYFARYPTENGTTLRLVRMVGLPGDSVVVDENGVRVGGERVEVSISVGRSWPAQVPADGALVLTDRDDRQSVHEVHPDSRTLGPVPLAMLETRVAGVLPF